MARARWWAIGAVGILILVGLSTGCATAPVTTGSDAPAPAPAQAPGGARAELDSGASDAVAKMREYLAAGLDRLAQGLVSDGIKQLVSVLAERQKLRTASSEAEEIAARAETELSKLGSALALEPDTVWLDAANNQVTGETLDPKKLQPSVILTIKQAGGRSLVSNAPVEFAFVKGSGVLTGSVNTNDFGQANCTVVSFDDPAAEQVVRASLVYRTGGFTYAFKGVERDFVYLPPAARAMILVLERSPLGVSSDPFIVDPIYQELKAVGYDFSLFNGSLSPEAFQRVYEGDQAAITAMGLEKEISYLVVVLSDCTSIRQLELGGRQFNLFVSDARATLRIVRRADGKLMYQTSVERAHARGTHGQGGTREKAAADVLRAISADLAAAVKRDLVAIRTALKGR